MTVRELVTWLGFKIDNGTLKEYEKKVESAKKKSSELSNAVGGIGKAVKLIGGAVAAAGIAALGKSILDTTGEVEQYRVTLGTMIGDQEKANKIIHDLDYSPVSDFYGTAAAIGGLQGMVTFGMQAEEASDTLTRLGDIAQGNGEAFKSLSLNMGQVFAKGKADATDLKQFVGQGFDVVGEVSSMTGKSRSEIEKAGVSYEQCAAALVHITSEGGKYNGMLAKQSKTLPGLIKQFQSLSAAIKESIGTAVLDKVKDLLSYFLSLGRAMQDNIASVGTEVFGALLDGIADVIIAFELLKIRMEKFGGAFTPVKAVVKDVFGFVGSVIQSSIPFLMSVAEAVLLAFKPVQAFVHPVLEALKPLFKDVFGFGAEQVSKLLPIIESLTPAFQYVGNMAAKVVEKLRPIISNIAAALSAAFKPITAFVIPVLKSLKTACETVFNALSGLLDDAGESTAGLAGIIESLTPIFSVLGNIVGGVLAVFLNGIETVVKGLNFIMPVLKPIVTIILAIVAAMKIWTAVQTALNIAMTANPVGAIIMAVVAAIVALIGVITLLVKNWDKVKAALLKGAKIVGDFFKKIWNAIKNTAIAAFNKIKDAVLKVLNAIKSAWGKITAFFASLWNTIVSAAKSVWSTLVDFFAGLVEGIKSIWNAITEFFSNLWDTIVSVAEAVWNTLIGFFTGLVEGIKSVWSTITEFFSNLWDTIISAASSAWNGIVGVFSVVIDAIKNVWGGITDFFSGLWDGLKESASSALNFIKDSFFGIFEDIKNQFFGFIDTLRKGWESVKGFFSGLWDGAVDFFTGGSESADSPATTKVNDMILTPNGAYSTHPDDTIFAMKDPASLVDRLAEFLAQASPSPSFALAGNSASQAVRQSVSNDYSRHSSSSVYNSPVYVTVNASGMDEEQARRAVETGVRGALRDAIAGSRGTIPSAEARSA